MNLLFLSSGKTTPTYRFRVRQLVPYLQAAGHRCTVAHSFPQKYDHLPWLGFRPSQALKRINRYLDLLRGRLGGFDAIILERELFHNASVDLERRFRRLAPAMILDIDDAVFLNFPAKMVELAGMVDLVLAGNRSLVEWARQYNPHVEWMPTCIDTHRYSPLRRDTRDLPPLVVGWMGTSGNLHNLNRIADGLRQSAKNCDFELRIVSDCRDRLDAIDLRGIRVRFVQWQAESEIDQLAIFDIGIMPLNDDLWNRYKCAGKLLQYMGLGIPSIASPVGVNSEIIVHGENGYLASTDAEWASALEKLMTHREHRIEVGVAGWKTIQAAYSVDIHVARWIAAVEACIARRIPSNRPAHSDHE